MLLKIHAHVIHRHLDGTSVDIEDNFHSSGCVGPAPKLFVGVASAKRISIVVVSCFTT